MKILTILAAILALLAIPQFANATIIYESSYTDFSGSSGSATSIGSYSSSTTTIIGSLDANGNGSDEWDFISFTTDDSWYLSLNSQTLDNLSGLFTYTSNGPVIWNALLTAGDVSTTRNAGTYWLGLTGVSNTGTGTYSFDLIVGDGQSSTIPEPSTLAIFALAMIGLASRRFKK